MQFIDWIPAVSTNSLFLVFLFLSRKLIVTRLTNSVKHEYEGKIEAIRSELRKGELLFQRELDARKIEIATLRETALTGLSHRQDIIFQKQLAAIEIVWQSVVALSQAKLLSSMMSKFKTDAVSKQIGSNEKLQEAFKLINGFFDPEKLKEVNASHARPFVQKPIWAYFSAYQAIVTHYVSQSNLFALGLGDELLKTDELISLVKTALPHQSEFLDKFGVGALFCLLEELETKILYEIDNMLSGHAVSEESMLQAAAILKSSEELIAKSQQDIHSSSHKNLHIFLNNI